MNYKTKKKSGYISFTPDCLATNSDEHKETNKI